MAAVTPFDEPQHRPIIKISHYGLLPSRWAYLSPNIATTDARITDDDSMGPTSQA